MPGPEASARMAAGEAGSIGPEPPVMMPADRLVAIARAICLSAGCDDEESDAVATHLVEANLKGHDSHGVVMLGFYVEALHQGRVRPGTRLRILRQSGPVLLLDGQLGIGQVIARDAMRLGVAAAKQHGVALVGLRRSHHIGRIGAWAEQCAEAGCVSIHFVNVTGHPPYVAPFGGRSPRAGTDPFCAGLPATDGPPIILDMATSKVAHGKVKVAHNRGAPVVEGALIDAVGNPSTDPAVMFAEPPGALVPFGEHKGYGLMVFCELLAGALTGGGTNQPDTPITEIITNNMLSIIIDPGALGEVSALKREVDAFAAWVKSSPPRAGFAEVLLPGEPERRSQAERLRTGIPLDERTLAGVRRAAALVGCDIGAWLAAPSPATTPVSEAAQLTPRSPRQ